MARIVATELGFRYIDHQIVTMAAEKAGVPPDVIERAERSRPFILRILDAMTLSGTAMEGGAIFAVPESMPPTQTDAREHEAAIQKAIDAAQEMGKKQLVEDCLALKLQAQGIDRAQLSASAALNTSIDRVASAVNSAHLDLRPRAAPDGTVTIMFSDIGGSTEKTAALGDTKWMAVLKDHGAIIRGQLRAHDGFEVKSEGDGFMLAFQSARKAIQCAMAMQRAFEVHNESAETPVRVRMGLHTGEVIKDGDDFFGIHVNLAARVAGKATGGEILASSLLKELTASGGDIAFGEPRAVEFKGIEGEHQVWPVKWNSQ